MAIAHTRRGSHLARYRGLPGDAIHEGYIPQSILELSGLNCGKEQAWHQPLITANTGLSTTASQNGYSGGTAFAIPIPWAADGAGLAYPAGTVLAIAGAPDRAFRSDPTTLVNAGVVITATLPDFFSVRRSSGSHIIRTLTGRTLFITGAHPGTTGTILVRQYNTYDNIAAGSPVTIETITVDGDKGPDQIIELPDLTLPINVVRTPPRIYYEVSWSGTPPYNVHLTRSAMGVYTGWIVPTVIPSGYTALEDAGQYNRTYDGGIQPRPNAIGPRRAIGELGRLMDPWTREWVGSGYRTTWDSSATQRVPRRRFGLPDTQAGVNASPNDTRFEWTAEAAAITQVLAAAPPGLLVGDDIREMTWWPIARGLMVDSSFFGFVESEIHPTPIPPYSVNYETLWGVISYGPGWRNIRVWCQLLRITGPAVLAAILLDYRVDGGTTTTVSLAALTGDGATGDMLDISGLIDSPRFNARLEIRMRCTIDYSGTGFQEVAFIAIFAASPRCDIPAPWRFPGRGCDDVPAAYKTGSLANLTPIGGVRHVAVGLLTSSWTIAATVTGETQTRIISFVCPTTGLWSITPPFGPFSTLGEFDGRRPASSQMGRAGKRFYGYARSSNLANLNGTWTLAEITRTITDVPSAGLAVLNSHLSPVSNGMFFGTIALPSAGDYRVWVKAAAQGPDGITIRFFASLTDTYCAEPAPIDRTYETCNPTNQLPLTTLTAPPGSPSTSVFYLVGAAATGAWSGRDGSLAAWTGYNWKYLAPESIPVPSSATLDSVFSIWDGSTWAAASTLDLISVIVTTTAAATLHVRVGNADDENIELGGLLPRGNLTIGWAAV